MGLMDFRLNTITMKPIDLKKEYPKPYIAGFEAGVKFYNTGNALLPMCIYVPKKYGHESEWPNIAFQDGFCDGYIESEREDCKTNFKYQEE